MIKGTQFTRTRVELDNQSYEDCTFTECMIVYAAKGPVTLTNPNFVNCRFVVEGNAADTLTFLAAMYRLAPTLIEQTFENIRIIGGKPPSGPSGGGWVTAG